jgi:endonuclease YncB( thermonuclease family)
MSQTQAQAITIALVTAMNAVKEQFPDVEFIIDGDNFRVLFIDITEQADVCELVRQGAAVDAEFSEHVIDVLIQNGIDVNDHC